VPEGDTVYVLARRLDAALAARTITRSDVRVPRYATVDLRGDEISEVDSRGKHLLIRTAAGRTIHSHLKMDGSWELRAPKGRVGSAGDDVRIVLDTEEVRAIGRRLSELVVVPTHEERRLVGHLGPDPLHEWDLEEALQRLHRYGTGTVSDALLEQRIVAGFGNIYRNEICFLRGIWPWTPWEHVDMASTLALGAHLLQANRETGRQVTTGIDRAGRRHYVYGRAGEPCRRCGTRIRREQGGVERVTYWCSHCQPELP
jgi:endonuclease-8